MFDNNQMFGGAFCYFGADLEPVPVVLVSNDSMRGLIKKISRTVSKNRFNRKKTS